MYVLSIFAEGCIIAMQEYSRFHSQDSFWAFGVVKRGVNRKVREETKLSELALTPQKLMRSVIVT